MRLIEIKGPTPEQKKKNDEEWAKIAALYKKNHGREPENAAEDQQARKEWNRSRKKKIVDEGKIVKDPKSDNPYLRVGHQNRDSYLKSLADDYDVPLKKVKALANLLGPSEDFDALVSQVNDLSDPGK